MKNMIAFTENKIWGRVNVVISSDGIVIFHEAGHPFNEDGTRTFDEPVTYVCNGVPQYTLDFIGSFERCEEEMINLIETWDYPEDLIDFLEANHFIKREY